MVQFLLKIKNFDDVFFNFSDDILYLFLYEMCDFRELWNNRTPPEYFMGIFKTLNLEIKYKTFYQLLELSGDENFENLLFTTYLRYIFNYDPIYCFADIHDLNNIPYFIGCNRLFMSCGSEIFKNTDITDENIALNAFGALQIVLECPRLDVKTKALASLTRCQEFLALIASVRILDPDKFIKTQAYVLADSELLKYINTFTGNQRLFLNALISPNVCLPNFAINLNDIVVISYSTLNLPLIKHGLFDLCRRQVMEGTFLHVLYAYLNIPSLRSAFLLTCLTPLIFNVSNESEYLTNIVQNLIDSECELPFGVSGTELHSLFVQKPDHIDDSRILEFIIRYPSLTPSLPDKLLELLDARNYSAISKLLLIALEDIEIFYPFIHICEKRNKLTDVLLAIIDHLKYMDNADDYHWCWSFLLSTTRVMIHTGLFADPVIYKDMFSKIKDEDISFILSCIEDINMPKSLIPTCSFITYANDLNIHQKNMYFFRYLVYSDISEKEQIKNEIKENPYLWDVSMLCITRFRQEYSFLVFELKPPNTIYINTTLTEICIKNSDNPNVWKSAILTRDTEIMLIKPPNSIDELDSQLFTDIKVLTGIATIDIPRYLQTITSWNFLCRYFGNHVFAQKLVELLIWTKWSFKTKNNRERVFCATAFCLIAVANNDSQIILSFLDTSISCVVNKKHLIDGRGFAHFVLILLLTLQDELLVSYTTKLLENIRSILTSCDITYLSEYTIFSVAFIKLSLRSSKLLKLIPTDIIGYLVRTNDYETIINYFIAKELLMKSEISF